jgi:hypothetical protein
MIKRPKEIDYEFDIDTKDKESQAFQLIRAILRDLNKAQVYRVISQIMDEYENVKPRT